MNEITDDPEFDGSFVELKDLADGKRTKRMWQDTGDWDDAMWSCSQSIGLIQDIPTCRDLLVRMVKEAEQCLRKANQYIVVQPDSLPGSRPRSLL